MRILVAGPGHLRTVPMFAQTVASLRELGHEVTPFNLGWKHPLDRVLRRPLKKLLGRDDTFLPALHSATALNARLLAAARACRAELFLAIFGFDIREQTVRALRAQGVRTACWWLNDPFHLDRSFVQAGWYDRYFTNAPSCVPAYHAAGFAGARGLLHAIYPPWHRPVTLSATERDAYTCDIAFAGDWETVREQALLRLAGTYRVQIRGPWRRKLPADSPLRACIAADWFSPDEMPRIAAGAAIVLNLHAWFGQDDRGTNPRVFEAAGCGAFQLCDWKQEIPGCFADGKELVLYRSLDELEEKVAYWLPREQERRAIAAAAAARAVRDHSYSVRLQELFALLT